jgi:hemerythrin-like domain-containing protein
MKQEDPLIRLIKYHEQISEYLDDIGEMLKFLDDEEAWKKIKPIDDFFQKNIVGHFKFEEEKIFSTCLLKIATPESIRLILELQREHGKILTKLEEFRKIIPEKDKPLNQGVINKLNLLGREILDILLAHASKEDDELLPILEKNRHIFDL